MAWVEFRNTGYKVSDDGYIMNPKGRILRNQNRGNGYKYVTIKGKTYSVHRLIAECFIQNPNGLSFVNHKDGNKQNNVVNNLEWCNNSMNQIHAYKVGLNPKHVGHKVGVIIISENGKIEKFDTKMEAALYLGYKTIMPLNRALKNGKVKKNFKILLDV